MSTDLVATGVLSGEEQRLLSAQWRSLRRVATGVAVLSSPAVFVYLHKQERWAIGWSLVGALLAIAAFRGLLDLLFHRFIRWPSLFGVDNLALREEDFIVAARLAGCGQLRIIFVHMVPSFTSHIIAATTLALPAMIISETSLSFPRRVAITPD